MKRRHKHIDTSFYDRCSNFVSSGNYYRIDFSASVPGDIGNRLGDSFKYAVVLASTFDSSPEYFKHHLDFMPDDRTFFLIRITRDDTTHGVAHENTNEKLVWKTKSGNCYYIDKREEDIPDHRVDYEFSEILEATPLRVIKGVPAPKPPKKTGDWREYHSLCASLDTRKLFK